MKSIVLCDDCAPERVLPLCEKYGLGIEIQGFYDPNGTGGAAAIIEKYKSLLPENIEKHLHAPFWDLCLGSANEKIKEVTRFYFDYGYEVAEKLGCESITVHQGYIPGTSWYGSWVKRSIAFWNEFFEAHPGSITVNMENLCELDPSTFIGVVDGFGGGRLAVNLDIGHAHCNSKVPVLQWIEELGDRIAYVHMHQNFGDKDSHLGLRDGNMPLKEVLEALEKHAPNAVWALENGLDYMEDSVAYLVELGYVKEK